jgi:serine/threonine protein phosphatase PrpC
MLRRQQQNRVGNGANLFPTIGGAFVSSSTPSTGGRSVEPRIAAEFNEIGIELGICSKQGKRPYQEDEFCAKAFIDKGVIGGEPCSESHFFGLFDGHAGGRCSKFVSTGIVQVLQEDPQIASNLPQCLKRSFHVINDNFLKLAERMRFQDGSTGISVIIRENKYMIANVGDCRAILVCNGKPIQLSKDQKPTNPEEQKRIYALGGHVVNCMGITRVNGVLAVSRAFGNRSLRDVIRPDAEITQRSMSLGDEFLVIASDGLWDVLSNSYVTELCLKLQNSPSQAIAEELVNQSLIRGSMDNITCHVAKLGKFVSDQLSASSKGDGKLDRDSPIMGTTQKGGLGRKFSDDMEDMHKQNGNKDFNGYIFPKRADAANAAGTMNSLPRPSTTSISDRSTQRNGAISSIFPNAQGSSPSIPMHQGYGQSSSRSTSVASPDVPLGQQPYGQHQTQSYSHGREQHRNGGGGYGQGENRFMAAYQSFHKDREDAGRKAQQAGMGANRFSNSRPMTGFSATGGYGRNSTVTNGSISSSGFQSISNENGYNSHTPSPRLLHSPITTRAQSNRYTQRVSTANSVSGRASIKRI